MKKSLLCSILFAFVCCHAIAHDHIDVGENPSNPNQLFLSGPTAQLALLVPAGEPFSFYLPEFPGGCYANELTFTTEVNGIPFATGSLPRVEILSITGPSGGTFAFWEIGAIAPTWTRDVSWESSGSDRPGFVVYEDGTGYGHIHGRAFSVNKAGTYQVTFRAVDDANVRLPSAPIALTFEALDPPQLSIAISGTTIRLGFVSRANLVYDVQRSTDLASGVWTTIGDPLDGTG
ncbi:MAG: hypothetical protein ACOVMP_10065, partial [Chthoniobacterales bacterium]